MLLAVRSMIPAAAQQRGRPPCRCRATGGRCPAPPRRRPTRSGNRPEPPTVRPAARPCRRSRAASMVSIFSDRASRSSATRMTIRGSSISSVMTAPSMASCSSKCPAGATIGQQLAGMAAPIWITPSRWRARVGGALHDVFSWSASRSSVADSRAAAAVSAAPCRWRIRRHSRPRAPGAGRPI